MLYKFKSKAAGDVIMLQANGRQMLDIIGKDASPASGGKGILLHSEMTKALAALEAAIAADDKERHEASQEAQAKGEPAPRLDAVSLHQRAVPLIDMIRRSKKENQEIVWGV